MPGNGNGGGVLGWGEGFGEGFVTGEGGRQTGGGTPVVSGEGGLQGPMDFGPLFGDKPKDTGPTPRVPVIREARNVQRANIDRTSLYDPTAATQALGADYLQARNASNPQPLGATGAGAVGYELPDSGFTERIYD